MNATPQDAATGSGPVRSPLVRDVGALIVHGVLAVLVALLLLAAGRPIYTDDLWWHLALGKRFAASGPWLAKDALLFTAAGPPAPAAWLFDVGTFALLEGLGFLGLRVAHAIAIVAILCFAWSLLRRVGGSSIVASLATGAFVGFASYRLFQLRPHLFTIAAALALFALLVLPRRGPTWRRIAAAAALCALWANVHAAFLLGPILVAAAAAGAGLAALWAPPVERAGGRARAWRLAAAAAVLLLATFANPAGPSAHLAYLAGGSATPDLTLVSDEWVAVHPFRAPGRHTPPTPLAWAGVWLLLGAVPWISWRALRDARSASPADTPHPSVDLALAGLAGASLVAMLAAVRFLWLAIFPLLLVAAAWRARGAAGARRAGWRRVPPPAVALALLAGFVVVGDWTLLSKGMPRQWSAYAEPYRARKYHAQAVWLLRDAGVSGNVFSDYFMGGFLGFWLAPDLRAFVNGSLNVPPEVMKAYRAIHLRHGLDSGPDFLALLDVYRVDFFVGVGLPILPTPNRPWRYTTSHLERADGWIPVFRCLRTSVYMRTAERNRENLRRLARYYADQGVPFDSSRGFDVDRVVSEAPEWALRHGIIPRDFLQLVSARFALDPARALPAAERLASIYAALGLYERAAASDARTLEIDPTRRAARRRRVWTLLHLDRGAAAREQARALEPEASSDRLTAWLVNAAREYPDLEDPREKDALAARVPLFTRREGVRLTRGFTNPEARVLD